MPTLRSQRRRRHPRLLPPSHLPGSIAAEPSVQLPEPSASNARAAAAQHGEAPAAPQPSKPVATADSRTRPEAKRSAPTVKPEPVQTSPAATERAVPPERQGRAGAAPQAVAGTAPAPAPPPQQLIAPTWQAVTRADVDRDLVFDRLPSDSGIVAPIAPADEDPPPEVLQQLDAILTALPTWGPAKVADPVQRARNILYIAGVPDVLQTRARAVSPR